MNQRPTTTQKGDPMGQERSERKDAAHFLSEILAAGSVGAVDVFRQAKQRGICVKTLRRAKQVLGVKSYRVWAWMLPAVASTPDAVTNVDGQPHGPTGGVEVESYMATSAAHRVPAQDDSIRSLLARCREFGVEVRPTIEGKVELTAEEPVPLDLLQVLMELELEVRDYLVDTLLKLDEAQAEFAFQWSSLSSEEQARARETYPDTVQAYCERKGLDGEIVEALTRRCQHLVEGT